MFTDADRDSRTIDFLTIGHICHDITPEGKVIGGAAAYTASIANALDCRTAIVTSASPADEWQQKFPGIAVHLQAAAATTVFENVYATDGSRIQTIHAVAGDLTLDDIPVKWRRPTIVHLGPVANEVDPALAGCFGNSILSIGPQGWMRRWDEKGHVYQVPWNQAPDVLPLAAITFLSLEDLASPEELSAYRKLAKTLVVTDGRRGCTVYHQGIERDFPAPLVDVVDTTGAGDIFAAAFLVRFHQTGGDVWESARFANFIAGYSVTAGGLPAKLSAIRHQLESLRHSVMNE